MKEISYHEFFETYCAGEERFTGIVKYPWHKVWYLNGKLSTAMEVFESLSDEEKEKAIWNMNEWK